MTANPMNSNAYLARQPILDAAGNLFAYELLFRKGPTANEAGEIVDAVRATAQVLENALNSMGVQKLVGKHKAFVNCNREMLLSGVLQSLDPQRFVLEVLETVEVDEAVVSSVTQLHGAGFEFALDDFVLTPEMLRQFLPVLPLMKYVKIDLVGNTPKARAEAARLLKSKGKVLLAEKVETEAEYRQCIAEGYDLFQGYFFARPELLSSRKIDSRTSGIMQILQVLRRNPEMPELESAFKKQPEVTLSLLRYMNSAAIALRQPISSIRQAIALVGQRNLQQWLMLMLYARSDADSAGQSPLFENAVQRARFLESIAKKLRPGTPLVDHAFLAGIMSRMDALCQVPMPNILADFDLGADISGALLEGKGMLGQMLLLISAVETGVENIVAENCRSLGIDEDMLSHSLEESYAAIAE